MKENGNMKKEKLLIVTITVLLYAVRTLQAQDTARKNISAGLMVGDPIGITLKYSLGNGKALDISLGPDYFGLPRLQIDKVKMYYPFLSSIIRAYVGEGLAIAFAKGTTNMFYSKEPGNEIFTATEDNGFQLGARAIVGLGFAPRKLPFELFVETGPLIGLTRMLDIDFDAAMGVRVRL